MLVTLPASKEQLRYLDLVTKNACDAESPLAVNEPRVVIHANSIRVSWRTTASTRGNISRPHSGAEVTPSDNLSSTAVYEARGQLPPGLSVDVGGTEAKPAVSASLESMSTTDPDPL